LKKFFCKYSPLTFFLAIFFLSCEREFPVHNYIVYNKLIAICFVDTDSSFIIKLSKTNTPYAEPSVLTNPELAVIELSDENNKSMIFKKVGDVCILKERFKQGNLYSLTVKHPEYQSIESKTILPYKLSNVIYKGTMEPYESGDSILVNKFRINAGQSKYLVIRHIIKKKLLTISGDTVSFNDTTWIDGISNNILNILPENAVNTALFVTLKPSSENIIEFKSFASFVKNEKVLELNSQFELISCNEEFFKYMRSIILYNWNANSSKNYYSSPIAVFSNIENGYGIFAGYSKTVFEVKHKK
jgi:hypothetical protein